MDNRFVNIDDLVRQRLGGGEEQERSGAWMRMQELLEKEERRKPFGMLYWKRAMSYVGVLLLLAAVSVGGYKMTTSLTGVAGSGNGTTPAANSNSRTEVTVNAGNTDNDNNNKTNVAATVGNKVTKHTTALATTQTTDKKHNSHSSTITAHTTSTIANTGNTGSTANQTKTTVVEDNGSKNQIVKVENKNTTGAATKPAMNTISNPIAAADRTSASGSDVINPKDDSKVAAKGSTAETKNTAGYTAIATTNNASVAQPADKVAVTKKGEAGENNIATSGVVTKISAVKANTSKKKNITVGQLPLASAVSSVKPVGHKTISGDNDIPNTNAVVKNAISNKAIASKHIAGTKLPSKTTDNTVAAVTHKNRNINKPQAAPQGKLLANAKVDSKIDKAFPKTKQVIATIKEPVKSKHNKTLHGKTLAVHAKTSVKAGLANTTTPVPEAIHTDVAANVKAIAGKRVIERIVMHESKTGTYPSRVKTRLDTISIDHTTVYNHKTEAEINADNAEAAVSDGFSKADVMKAGDKANTTRSNSVATKTTASKKGSNKSTGNKTATGNKADNKNSNSATGNDAADANTGVYASSAGTGEPATGNTAASGTVPSNDPVNNAATASIVPEASLSAAAVAPAASTPLAAETKSGIKRKKGSQMLENLSAMFNDVKYKITGIQFAPGLTAGINGTFFGPNSFRGFQFGFTGTWEIDEKWSFLTELKYYHRMNNNYAMHDTYFDKATKDSIVSSFSFSTLHSFELPVALRYTVGHMTFFGGGNLVYTLGVNTGPDPTPYQVQSIPANAKTAPALTEVDFASRFGVGYLFGITYNVSPNVTFDFRSVQTVWDNSKSAGGKTVSEQLYKSPSLQFSIGYRLGHNKDKE